MALATSNLRLSEIYAALNFVESDDEGVKGIFYTNGRLKTVEELGQLVNGNNLDPAYCPGADAESRLSYLLTHRRLSCFKGYSENQEVELIVEPTSFVVDGMGSPSVDTTCYITTARSWVATALDEWIHLDRGSGEAYSSLGFYCDNNLNALSRNGSIVVTAGTTSVVVSVYQNPA